jgi:hypothetical protein
MLYAGFAARRLRAEAQCHKLPRSQLRSFAAFPFFPADPKAQALEDAEAPRQRQ